MLMIVPKASLGLPVAFPRYRLLGVVSGAQVLMFR